MYKYTNDMLPSVMHELYKKNNEIHTYDTRNKDLFRIDRGQKGLKRTALDVMTSMCFVHSKSSLTVTPRYLSSFTSSSTCPDNSYWYRMGVCFLDTFIILHLAALNLIPHVVPQLSSKFRSFCRSF